MIVSFVRRRPSRLERVGLLLAAAAAAACDGRSNDVDRADVSTAPPAQSRELTMTREQIQHGGVQWEPARAATMTEAVETPARLAPNEDRTVRLAAPETAMDAIVKEAARHWIAWWTA